MLVYKILQCIHESYGKQCELHIHSMVFTSFGIYCIMLLHICIKFSFTVLCRDTRHTHTHTPSPTVAVAHFAGSRHLSLPGTAVGVIMVTFPT